MIKIDIISGFLGAGKTNLINRLVKEAYTKEKIVIIENEFGEVGIDSGFLEESGVKISEMNSGCICCSLVGDFSKALKQVADDYSPERIIIEPSGVGKLSDVIKAVRSASLEGSILDSAIAVVDVNKCKMYMKNFGEFFNDQISSAECIVFSHTDKTTDAKLAESLALVRQKNPTATIITTPCTLLDIGVIVDAIEKRSTLENHIKDTVAEDVCEECGCHHHHHEHCDHEHHHEHCDHEHHHEHCDHEHHHEHCDHDHHHEHCDHDHHHEHCDHEHHHHHADEVFTSWGRETVKKFDRSELESILEQLQNSEKYGMILRAKGMVECKCGSWLFFDYVPGEPDIRIGSPTAIGKICVIGSNVNEAALSELFGL